MPSIATLQRQHRQRQIRLAKKTGYSVEDMGFLRIVGPNPRASRSPTRGSEVFIYQLLPDVLEDELFYFCERAGDIYELRLMMKPRGLLNRGFAFVRYSNPRQAESAIAILNDAEFRPHVHVVAEKSAENSRLFISGIPHKKTKQEIWEELQNAGMEDITNVIIYKSHLSRLSNRGYVFVEFRSHKIAARNKCIYSQDLKLWGRSVIIDWADPQPEVDTKIMQKVTRLFLRNLDVTLRKQEMTMLLSYVLGDITITKVYKELDYCFVHFETREDAEKAMHMLRGFFARTDVEVSWSKPPNYKKRARVNRSPRFQNTSLRKAGNVSSRRHSPLLRTFPSNDINNNFLVEGNISGRSNSPPPQAAFDVATFQQVSADQQYPYGRNNDGQLTHPTIKDYISGSNNDTPLAQATYDAATAVKEDPYEWVVGIRSININDGDPIDYEEAYKEFHNSNGYELNRNELCNAAPGSQVIHKSSNEVSDLDLYYLSQNSCEDFAVTYGKKTVPWSLHD